jgi:hypothetical protein
MDPETPPLARQPVRVPWWLRLADAAAAVLAVLALWQMLTGGARGGLLDYVVPAASAWPLVFALGSVLLVRHLARPSPTAFSRLRDGLRRTSDSPTWGPVCRAFVGTRLMVFVVAFFAVAAIGHQPKPGFLVSHDLLVNLPARYDAGWYGRIAQHGYRWRGGLDRESPMAFFPAMPLLMRGAGHLLGAQDRAEPGAIRLARVLWGGVAISLTAFLFALYYLVKLSIPLVGEERAANAVLLLACYPFAFAFNAPYTESLFLLATVASAYHFHRGQWAVAAGWGLLTGLTRPNGFVLAVPLALIAMHRSWLARRAGDPSWARAAVGPMAAALMPVAGMMLFTTYLFSVTGVWFAWSRSHAAWGRTFQGIEPLIGSGQELARQGLVNYAVLEPFSTLNASALIFALLMIWPVQRTLGVPWAAYVALTLVPPVLAGGVLSMGRLTSTLFPLFLALSAIISSRAVPAWAAAFAVLQGLCVALFFTWRQLY